MVDLLVHVFQAKEAALLSLMPKTDKQIRQEKRKKEVARAERKKLRRGEGGLLDEDEAGEQFNKFSVVSSSGAAGAGAGAAGGDVSATAVQGAADSAVRDLIKRGLGREGATAAGGNDKEKSGFEIVPQGATSKQKGSKRAREAAEDEDEDEGEEGGQGDGAALEVFDERKYDSDNEVYDSHDRIVTLALGTMVKPP